MGVFSLTLNRSKKVLSPLGNSSGQAVIEFVLAMILILSFLMFIIQVTLFLSFGNFVQYATFMSARAYESGWPTQKEQVAHAEAVLSRTVKKNSQDRLPWVAKGSSKGTNQNVKGADIGTHANFNSEDESLSWLEGVRYSFKGRLFSVPLGPKKTADETASDVDLTSESWLSREPTFEECSEYMNKTMKAIFDNGC